MCGYLRKPFLDVTVMDSNTPSSDLTLEESLSKAYKDARTDGIFAGLSAGLTGALISSKLYKLGRNSTIFAGVATGALSGYFFYQAFFDSNVAVARAQHREKIQREREIFGSEPTPSSA